MTRKLLLLVVVAAHVSFAATPREYVADKVGDARSKLKAAKKKIDDLPPLLAEAGETFTLVRGKLKGAIGVLGMAQANITEAQTNLAVAINRNKQMGELLRALPPATPTRDMLIKSNDQQAASLANVDSSLKTASTSTADGLTAIGEADAKLALIQDKMGAAKDLPSTKQLNEIIDLMDAVLKVNKAAMPDFPNIKELK